MKDDSEVKKRKDEEKEKDKEIEKKQSFQLFLEKFLSPDMSFSHEDRSKEITSFVFDDNFKRLFFGYDNGEVNIY